MDSQAWYSHSEPPQEAATLVCPNCSKPLFLVTQVYAPVDTDRTLYVFGCNSVACTETPGSWRVLRDENEVAAIKAAAAAAPSTSPSAAAPQKVASAWDAGSDSDSSDWGDNDDDDDADPFATTSSDDGAIDLEKLLLQRDDAMSAATNPSASKKPTKPSATAAAAPLASAAPTTAALAFPAKPIEVVDEPYEDYTAEHDYSHENALLEDYMKQEEEEKSADVGDLRKILSSAKKGAADSSSGGAAGKASGESYEKTPAQQRHFLRFQKRISRCPLQCLRYDYGGEPLWPTPKPQRLKVPACVCGEERVFELQLTPTLMYFLKVDAFASPVASAPAVDASTSAAPPLALKSAGTAMDWMGVLVYSCPKSCSRSREEFVYVLPAEKA